MVSLLSTDMLPTRSSEHRIVPSQAASPSASSAKAVSSKCSPWLTPLAYFLGRWVVIPRFFGRIQVSGQENLPLDGPVILAPTHRSRWDALLVPHLTGRPVTGRDLHFMVTADEVCGLQGWLIRRLGGFPVNVNRPTISSLRHGFDLLNDRKMMVIFPEGGIFRDRTVHPLKPGLARLALQAETLKPGLGVRIVPISLQYDQAVPSWGANVTMTIGRPLEVADYTQYDAKHAARALTQDLHTALTQLDNVCPPRALVGAR